MWIWFLLCAPLYFFFFFLEVSSITSDMLHIHEQENLKIYLTCLLLLDLELSTGILDLQLPVKVR